MSPPASAIAMLALAMALAGCPFAMDDDYYTVSQSPEPNAAPNEPAAAPDGGLISDPLDAGVKCMWCEPDCYACGVDPCKTMGRQCLDAGCKGKECGRD